MTGATDPVVVLSVPGLETEIAMSLIAAGGLPNLAELLRGPSARLQTPLPYSAPAPAMALATGQDLQRHGVPTWLRPSSAPQGYDVVGPGDWQAPAFWDLAAASGRQATCVGWPVTHPASRGHATVISDGFALAHGADFDRWPLDAASLSDPDLAAALAEMRLHPTELTTEMVAPFLPHLAEIDRETDPRLGQVMIALAECASIHGAATYLLDAKRPDLLVVHLDLIDRLSAGFLAFSAPKLPHVTDGDARHYGGVTEGAYHYVDMMLGRYLALMDARARLLVVSAYGHKTGSTRPTTAPKPGQNAPLIHGQGLVLYRGASGGDGGPERGLGSAQTGQLADVSATVLALLGVPAGPNHAGQPLFGLRPAAGHGPQLQTDPSPMPPDYVARRVARLIEDGQVAPPGEDPMIAREDTHLERWRREALALMAARDHRSAAAILDRSLALRPDQPEILHRRTACALALGDADTARRHLETLARIGAMQTETLFLLGQLADLEGCVAALDHYDAALEMALETPSQILALAGRVGLAHLMANRFSAAAAAYDLVLDRMPHDVAARNGAGLAALKEGRLDAAEQHLTLAHKADPTGPRSLANLATLRMVQGAAAQAVDLLETARASAPNDPEIATGLARARRLLAHMVTDGLERRA